MTIKNPQIKPLQKLQKSFWNDALKRLVKNRLSIFGFWIIVIYSLAALLAKFNMIASPWSLRIASEYSPPDFSKLSLFLGTDIHGQSVLYKVIHGSRVALSVGLVSSLISIPIGVFLGALAGYFGGWIDTLIEWFYTVISSVPNILLLIAITYVMGKGIFAVYIALGATSWVGLARVIRAEFIKHKSREYVVAAASIGASHPSRIFRHILPNVFHQVIINLSIQFQVAVKSEVILSYLGLGVQDQPSWGIMIDDARLELARGVWWQLTGSSVAMFALILAFNLFGDGLRDALDPKSKN